MLPALYSVDHRISIMPSGVTLRLLSIEVWAHRVFLRICADEASIPGHDASPARTPADVATMHDLQLTVETDKGEDLPMFYRQVGGTGLEWTSMWGYTLRDSNLLALTISGSAAGQQRSTHTVALT